MVQKNLMAYFDLNPFFKPNIVMFKYQVSHPRVPNSCVNVPVII